MNQEEKIDKILKTVNDMNIELAKSLVHQDQHRLELNDHKKTIDDLVALKNKGIGFSLLGGTALGAFFTYIFRHIF